MLSEPFLYIACSMRLLGMRFLLVATALVLTSLPAAAHADTPATDLVVTGAQSFEWTTSDVNACYFDTNSNGASVFNAQLTDLSSNQIVTITILGSVGDHPAKADDGHAQLTLVGLDATSQDNPLLEWDASGGTVTLDNAATDVALDDGSASTQGALGHVDADLTSSEGSLHISGPFACHLAG